MNEITTPATLQGERGLNNYSKTNFTAIHVYRQNKKLPPYGKQILRAKANGLLPPQNQIFIMYGELAWEHAHAPTWSRWTVVFPIDTSPDDFRWDFIANHEALFFVLDDIAAELLERIALFLLRAGALIVRAALSFPTTSLRIFGGTRK